MVLNLTINRMKKSNLHLFLISIITLLFICSNSYSQTFEEFKKQEQLKFQAYTQQQQKEINQLKIEFAEYIQKRDKEWIEYLQKEWKNFSVYKGDRVPANPKPVIVPEYSPIEDKPEPVTPPRIMPEETPDLILPLPVPKIVKPNRKPIEEKEKSVSQKIKFYSNELDIEYDPFISDFHLTHITNTSISKFWQEMSKVNYSLTIERLLQAKTKFNLNDYGYYKLVSEFAKKVYTTDNNTERLLTWFLLVRSGLGARAAMHERKVLLLLPIKQHVYENRYLKIDGKKYYIFPESKVSSIYTYEKDYQESDNLLDYSISKSINLSDNETEKQLTFSFKNETHSLTVKYNPDIVDFLTEYPKMELDVYLNAATSVQVKESIALALKPLIDNLNEVEATNLILRFVQLAFDYKTDPEQFGYEKYFFVEETLFYPFSDCEDRSILFSYLVRELIGLKVVALEYPGHVSTAVCFASPPDGNYLIYKNEKYVVADPTYVYAPVGIAMNKYKELSPKIHAVKNDKANKITEDIGWDFAEKNGLHKGTNSGNSKILADGSVLLTGYYKGTVNWGTSLLKSSNDKLNCMVAKINSGKIPVWARNIDATGNVVGLCIEETLNDNIVVAGVYSGTLNIDNKQISATEGKADLFMASFTKEGNFRWINHARLDTLPQISSISFSTVFNDSGKCEETSYVNYLDDDLRKGLIITAEGKIIYSGQINELLALTGVNETKEFASYSSFAEISNILQSEIDKLINQNIDSSIAGLLAAIHLVKNLGYNLSGKQIQQLFDKSNPEFKNTYSNVYETIGKINSIENNSGIIKLKVNNGRNLKLGKIKISDESTLSVAELPDGNVKLEILSGIQVGKMVVWYDLNYIKTNASEGDLLFDYDTDHAQAWVNIKNDLLY